MANLTPVEQDDSLAITRLEITDPVLAYDPGNPGAGTGKANEQAQLIANTLLFLRRRVGVQGNWDMTGVDADTVPASTLNLEMTTATVSAAQYTGTPVNGSSLFKMAASTAIKKESAARSARLRASTGGGNFTGVSALIYSNHDATAADVAASLMGALTGTCTHFAGVFLDGAGVIGAGAFKIVMRTDDPINGNVSETLVAAGGYTALDQIYSTFNGTTGLFSVTVNAGSPVAGTNAWDISGTTALRGWVLGYHTANPPSLPDVTYDFDFSDNTSGRTGFQTTNDPAVPSGAADGKRYLVSVAGSYGGRSAAIGDIVEFHTSLAAIQVLPAITWTQPLIEALVNPYITANPAAVQALIDASLASNVAPTVEYDVETEYATLGGANPGEFEMGPLVNGATLWSSASTFTALNTYASGYTPVPGDSFFLHFNEFDPTLAITAVGTHNVAVASDWDYAAYTGAVPADFMRTPRKRYQFVFTYVDGTNDRWTLQNPDVVAWGDSVTAAPLAIGVTAGTRGRPGTTTVVSSTGNGEIYIPLVADVAANGAEPFKVGQSCRIVIAGNTTRIRIIGDSSGVGGITFTSNLPVQSIVVGPVNEPAVDIVGIGHAITVTYQGSDTWHIFAPTAEDRVRAVSIADIAASGAIGAASVVDDYDLAVFSQTTATVLLSNPAPTNTTKARTFRWYNAGSVPLWSAYGQFIPVGGFADQVYIPGTGWKGIGTNQPQIIYMSGTSVTFPSDTNENNSPFVTIPGGFLGANSVVNISTILENTSGTSGKTVKIKFGAFNPYSSGGVMNAATSSVCIDKPVIALNSTSAQITQAQLSYNGSAGASTTLAPPTGTVDTAADVLIQCSVQKVTGGDTTILRSARVTFSYGG